jgi:A/G-specific adenine glycosylase
MAASTQSADVDSLLCWYRSQRRDLPWRRTRDPYHIWLSEIMLQQTQVVTVIPYYLRFIERYPNVEMLAASEPDELLALWQGLGYYARARNLRRAAQMICKQHQGRLPATRRELLALPGIGEYTAAAILSISFGQDIAAIDGNVKRVLARLYDLDLDIESPAARRWLAEASTALLPAGQASDYNQAMMELGATVCLPRSPACDVCPLSDVCLARAHDTIPLRPVTTPRRQTPTRELVAAHCVREGRLLIVRRPPTGLLGGLWELPSWELAPAEAPASALAAALAGHAESAQIGAEMALVRHAYTHFAVHVHILACELPSFAPGDRWDGVHWLPCEELGAFGLTGVTLKALRQSPWLNPRLL